MVYLFAKKVGFCFLLRKFKSRFVRKWKARWKIFFYTRKLVAVLVLSTQLKFILIYTSIEQLIIFNMMVILCWQDSECHSFLQKHEFLMKNITLCNTVFISTRLSIFLIDRSYLNVVIVFKSRIKIKLILYNYKHSLTSILIFRYKIWKCGAPIQKRLFVE